MQSSQWHQNSSHQLHSPQPPTSRDLSLCRGRGWGDAAVVEPWIFARSAEGLSAKLASVVFLMWFVVLLMWTPLGIFSVSHAGIRPAALMIVNGMHTPSISWSELKEHAPTVPSLWSKVSSVQRSKPNLDTSVVRSCCHKMTWILLLGLSPFGWPIPPFTTLMSLMN